MGPLLLGWCIHRDHVYMPHQQHRFQPCVFAVPGVQKAVTVDGLFRQLLVNPWKRFTEKKMEPDKFLGESIRRVLKGDGFESNRFGKSLQHPVPVDGDRLGWLDLELAGGEARRADDNHAKEN